MVTDLTTYKYTRSTVMVFMTVINVITVNKHETKPLIHQTPVDCTGHAGKPFSPGIKGEERLWCTRLSLAFGPH